MIKSIKLSIILPLVLSLVAMPSSPILAYQDGYIAHDPQALVCRSLNTVGLGCDYNADKKPYVSDYQPAPVLLNFDVFGESSSLSNNSEIKNATAPKDLTGQKINLVSVPGSEDVYVLVNGQKHIFPSSAVFYDYGYTFEMIQPISQRQLDKYPRAHLVKVKGDATIYYLTEGGLVRRISDPKKIFEFYGDRTEDIITISRKEFNFYPTNQYVYQESPQNLDVFQISAEGKRYLTPMAVARRDILWDQVAPISQAELNFYKTLAPLLD